MLIALIVIIAVACIAVTLRSRNQWRWQARLSQEQNVRMRHQVTKLEQQLLLGEDSGKLWYQAQRQDTRAERALVIRLHRGLDQWEKYGGKTGSR